jgi:hypothetical protein
MTATRSAEGKTFASIADELCGRSFTVPAITLKIQYEVNTL